MFIQVRSVVLSHECDVIVDPSADAALPTSTLVQLSHVGQTSDSPSCSLAALPGRTTSEQTPMMSNQVRSRRT